MVSATTEVDVIGTTDFYNTTTHLYDTYNYFVHPHWKTFPPIPDYWHYIAGAFITFVGFGGVLGNMLVIYIFTTSKNLKTPSNMLIVNLAISDFTFCVVNGFPLFSLSAFNKKWLWGDAACEFYGLIGGIFGLMSINTLAAIAVDRYLVITKPLQAARRMTRKKAFMMIVVVWIWSLMWSTPPIFGWGRYLSEGFQTSCTFDYLTRTTNNISFIIGMYVCSFTFPLGIILTCYVKIYQAIKKHNLEMLKMADKLNASDIKANKEKHNSEVKIAKIAIMLVLLFVLSWSPYATVALVAQFGDARLVTPYVSEIPVLFAKASAMHNPLVYALSHPKFRDALWVKMPWLMCCCDPPKEKPTTSQAKSRNLSRTVSCDSDVVGGNVSEISQISNDSAYGQELEMKVEGRNKETSFTNQAHNNYRSAGVNSISNNDLVKDLVQALVGVASAQRQQVIQPVYLPNLLPNSTPQTRHPTSNTTAQDQDPNSQLLSLAQMLASGGIPVPAGTPKKESEGTKSNETTGTTETKTMPAESAAAKHDTGEV